jgi:hypothetical protein
MSDEIGQRLLDKLMYIIAMLKEHGGSGEAIEWCETASAFVTSIIKRDTFTTWEEDVMIYTEQRIDEIILDPENAASPSMRLSGDSTHWVLHDGILERAKPIRLEKPAKVHPFERKPK